jgi:hypothetical protein
VPLHKVSICTNLPDTERFWVSCEDCPSSYTHLVASREAAIRAVMIHIMRTGDKTPEQIIGWRITPNVEDNHDPSK